MKDTSEYLDRYQGEQAEIVEENISDYHTPGRNATVFHVCHQKNWYGRVHVSWKVLGVGMGDGVQTHVELPDELIPAIIKKISRNEMLVPREAVRPSTPTAMLLWCPECGERHVDVGEFATRPHHTHACQSCGMVWRPAIENTTGVKFLPGFKNDVRP